MVTAKNVSGDVRVGIGSGTPVWTDVSTVTASVANWLTSVGKPPDGQDYVELRASTVSGDVHLSQVSIPRVDRRTPCGTAPRRPGRRTW